MDMTWDLNDDLLEYEIGDYANHLVMTRLCANFMELPRMGQDVMTSMVMRYTTLGIMGNDDAKDVRAIYDRFVELTG